MTASQMVFSDVIMGNHNTIKPFNNTNISNGRDCDETDSPSDSDYSYMTNLGVHCLDGDEVMGGRGGNGSGILKVRTQSESLSLKWHRDPKSQKTLESLLKDPQQVGDDDGNAEDDEETSPSNRTVQFQDVEIREYPYCIGDNPSCLLGVPLSIDWHVQDTGRLSVDDYESGRPDRRCSEQLRIPSFLREELLRNCGYSRKDIVAGMRNVNLARQKRSRTNGTHQLQTILAFSERLVRGAKNATVGRAKKRQEREWIDQLRFRDQQGLYPGSITSPSQLMQRSKSCSASLGSRGFNKDDATSMSTSRHTSATLSMVSNSGHRSALVSRIGGQSSAPTLSGISEISA